MTQRWQDVRPQVVTDEQRVAEARQEMDDEAAPAMTLYDRLASTAYGSRLLAQARIRREVLRCLHRAQAASGLSIADIATATGDRRREVKQAFDGDGNIQPSRLARYLHAMGYEVELTLVAAGEPRRKVVAGEAIND